MIRYTKCILCRCRIEDREGLDRKQMNREYKDEKRTEKCSTQGENGGEGDIKMCYTIHILKHRVIVLCVCEMKREREKESIKEKRKEMA